MISDFCLKGVTTLFEKIFLLELSHLLNVFEFFKIFEGKTKN